MAHLRWADMLDFPDMDWPTSPPKRDAAVQTDDTTLPSRELSDWQIAEFYSPHRGPISRDASCEILNFLHYILELMLNPWNRQLRWRLRQWQNSLRSRMANCRLGFTYAFAVYGIRF